MINEDIKADLIGYLKQIKSLSCLMIENSDVTVENIMTIEDLCDLALKKAKNFKL